MKTNKEPLRTAMDRRLSFLDDLPSCRAAVQHRIAQEEEPVMKRKLSLGFVFAMVLLLLSAIALAASLLLSPRVSAARLADQALLKNYGISEEMQTFFGREEEELPDGAVRVTYTGAGSLDYALGTYTVLVRNGKAETSWSHDGEDTSGGYEAEAWGLDQLRQMMADTADPRAKAAFLARADAISEKHRSPEAEEVSSEGGEGYFVKREAEKTAALKARKLSEETMIETGRQFIISSYGLNDEQASRLDLYTNSFEDSENCWYEMVNGKPCFLVEYLLGNNTGDPADHMEKDGYYKIYVNVETGVIEQYEYNSSLGGVG